MNIKLPDANEVAEKLCIKAEKLGLCHPTENMIAECLHDFEWNALMYPEEAWEHHGGKPLSLQTRIVYNIPFAK